MSIEKQVRDLIQRAVEADPTALEVMVYGVEGVEPHMLSDTKFIDSLARVMPAISEGLILVAQEVDKLRGPIPPSDRIADTS